MHLVVSSYANGTMATKLIKKKVVFLTVGTKKYKYIETLLEISSKKKKEPTIVDCIDLTKDDSTPLTSRLAQQYVSEEAPQPYLNSPRFEQL